MQFRAKEIQCEFAEGEFEPHIAALNTPKMKHHKEAVSKQVAARQGAILAVLG